VALQFRAERAVQSAGSVDVTTVAVIEDWMMFGKMGNGLNGKTKDGTMMSEQAIPIAKLVPNKWNPNRLSSEKRAELLESLQVGFDTSHKLLVRPLVNGQLEIVDGEQRWRILSEDLGMKEIPSAWIEVRELTDEEAKVLCYRLNSARSHDFDPFLEGALFFSMWERGEGKLTQTEIAERFGVTQPRVSERIAVYQLPEEIKETYRSADNLKPTHLLKITQGLEEDEVTELTQRVATEKLSVRKAASAKRDIQRRKENIKSGNITRQLEKELPRLRGPLKELDEFIRDLEKPPHAQPAEVIEDFTKIIQSVKELLAYKNPKSIHTIADVYRRDVLTPSEKALARERQLHSLMLRIADALEAQVTMTSVSRSQTRKR
jgi:ParB family chromosome partitioning protein